jgi:hypothetical protein
LPAAVELLTSSLDHGNLGEMSTQSAANAAVKYLSFITGKQTLLIQK